MKDIFFIVRLLRRNPMIFIVNVIGLGLSLTTVIITLTYIRYEYSYDKHFKTKDRLVRLYSRVTDNTNTQVYGISLRKAYTQLPASVPEVEAAVQLYHGWMASVDSKENKLERVQLLFANNEFFDVFGLNLRFGDIKTALVGKKSVVITSGVAEKLFKSTNCVGKTIESDGVQFVITGVIDEIPKNSHFSFDMLVSLSTLPLDNTHMQGLEFQTYYLLKSNVDQKNAAVKIAVANNVLMQDWAKTTNSKVQSGVEPLADLYLHSAASGYIPIHGSLKQILIIGLIALFVLLTTLVSYINLFIIYGEKRIKEISTRTICGATKGNIAKLFFIETAIIFIFSSILAFLLTYASLPYISGILLSKVDLSDLLMGWNIISVLMVLIILFVISSGYLVLYLSRMKYSLGTRGKISNTGNRNRLSTASVFIQFTVTTFFISCVVIVLSQIRFMQNIPLGFEKNNVISITNCSASISKQYESIKAELLKLPFIIAVSGGEHFMGRLCSGEYIRNTWDVESNNKVINEYREKPGFGELMQLQLIDGRFFRESMADSLALVLNESAIKLLGLKPKAGQTVLYNDKRLEVIGVVKDFYFKANPGEPIEPLVIANCFWGTPIMYIRSQNQLTESQVTQIKSVFQRFDENFVFNHQELLQVFNGMYQNENRLVKMVSLGAIQVIIISLISLLVLTIIKNSLRTKEIGIRKVLGSSVGQVISSLLKETLIIVSIAVLVASILSYLVMNHWLMDFYQRIHLHPRYFVISALFTTIIAIIATLGQSWYAALRNPVDAIRHE